MKIKPNGLCSEKIILDRIMFMASIRASIAVIVYSKTNKTKINDYIIRSLDSRIHDSLAGTNKCIC